MIRIAQNLSLFTVSSVLLFSCSPKHNSIPANNSTPPTSLESKSSSEDTVNSRLDGDQNSKEDGIRSFEGVQQEYWAYRIQIKGLQSLRNDLQISKVFESFLKTYSEKTMEEKKEFIEKVYLSALAKLDPQSPYFDPELYELTKNMDESMDQILEKVSADQKLLQESVIPSEWNSLTDETKLDLGNELESVSIDKISEKISQLYSEKEKIHEPLIKKALAAEALAHEKTKQEKLEVLYRVAAFWGNDVPKLDFNAGITWTKPFMRILNAMLSIDPNQIAVISELIYWKQGEYDKQYRFENLGDGTTLLHDDVTFYISSIGSSADLSAELLPILDSTMTNYRVIKKPVMEKYLELYKTLVQVFGNDFQKTDLFKKFSTYEEVVELSEKIGPMPPLQVGMDDEAFWSSAEPMTTLLQKELGLSKEELKKEELALLSYIKLYEKRVKTWKSKIEKME